MGANALPRGVQGKQLFSRYFSSGIVRGGTTGECGAVRFSAAHARVVAGHVSGHGLAVHRNRTRRAFAHDQLSRFDSALSTDGRALARKLEKKLRVPVYYCLSKHFGRSDQAERKRKRPSCGKAWLRKEPAVQRAFNVRLGM